eukprot:7160796-Pyramimonas_sp.AAC.2
MEAAGSRFVSLPPDSKVNWAVGDWERACARGRFAQSGRPPRSDYTSSRGVQFVTEAKTSFA